MKTITILIIIMGSLSSFGQSITNTLGSSGKFIIEDNSNSDLFILEADGDVFFPTSGKTFTIGGSTSINFATLETHQNGSNKLGVYSFSSTSFSRSELLLSKSRGSIGAPAAVQAGDLIGEVHFQSYNGSAWIKMGTIVTQVDDNDVDACTMTFHTKNNSGNDQDMLIFSNDTVHFPLSKLNIGTALGSFSGTALEIDANGNVFKSSSDVRLKKDISILTYGLAEIMKLKPVKYHWKTEQKNSPFTYGLIAQDILPIMPEIVPLDKKGFYEYRHQYLIPVLVNAIQEQQKEIEILKTKNEKLVKRSESAEIKADLKSLKAEIEELKKLLNYSEVH